MKAFDAIEEAREAAATAGEAGPVLSWGAADYYRALSESARAEWERQYIDELVRLSQPARLVTPYVRRPQ